MKKVFLLFIASLFIGIVAVVLWVGTAYAPPPFPVPPKGGLPACQADLADCNAQPPAPVPQTGQTTCWNSTRAVIPCAGTGQDGDVQAGVMSPVPRFTDNGDGTIRDNLTGLVWLKLANCFGARTWADALDDANTLLDGACDLTDGSVARQWYLSNRKQLESLLDLGNFNPALPTGHPFVNFQSSFYWTSTTFASSPGGASFVNFFDSFAGASGKGVTFFVIAVRGGA